MGHRVVQSRDALLGGAKSTWAAYLPVALINELKRCAVVDGYKSTGTYVADLLVFALRQRERERLKELQQR